MASTYTPLGVELMVTGENAGTWGTKTNTNLQILEQITGGYSTKSIAGGTQTTALTVVDGNVTGTAQFRMIEFTGTITGNQIVTIPLDIETFYFLRNSTSGANTVQFKYVSGSDGGVTFSATDKGDKLVVATANDGTNPQIKEIALSSPPGGSNTQIQFNDSGSFGGSANLTFDGNNVQIAAQGDLRLADADSSNYVALQAPATVGSNVTLTLPTNDGDADQALITDGSGNLSFSTISGGASWQAVVTAATKTAVAGEGYFLNTTSNAITLTLPSSAAIGDFVSFVDYAGTFDTNNLTIARNGHKIQGATADLVVSTERAANTLVYVDATQGWLLQNK
jgi:hypothetical protein